MLRSTDTSLPVGHPFRTVYLGERGGKRYRVARDGRKPGWRLDRSDGLLPWEAANATLYPSRDAAVAAFRDGGA